MAAERIHVALVADGRYLPGLAAARASIAAACSDPSRLEFHEFGSDAALAERIRRDFGTYKGSPMAFLRLYLPEQSFTICSISKNADSCWSAIPTTVTDASLNAFCNRTYDG